MSEPFVVYKFLHETDSTKKSVKINASKISVKELRSAIIKASGLEHEYNRAFDLCIYVQNKDGTLQKINDDDFIEKFTQVIVQRSLKSQIEDSKLEIGLSSTSEQKIVSYLPFPREYLCAICSKILSSPVVIRCTSKCGKTACRSCVKEAMHSTKFCPFCGGMIYNVVPNKRLTGIISKLNLSDFNFQIPSSLSEFLPGDSRLCSQEPLNDINISENDHTGPLHTAGKSEGIESKPVKSIIQNDSSKKIACNSSRDKIDPSLVQRLPPDSKSTTGAPKCCSLSTSKQVSQGHHTDKDSQCDDIFSHRRIIRDLPNENKDKLEKNFVAKIRQPSASPPESVNHIRCPFSSTNDIISLFPKISNHDFAILKAAQIQMFSLIEKNVRF